MVFMIVQMNYWRNIIKKFQLLKHLLIDILEDTSWIVMSGRLENDSFKILDTVVSMNGFHAFPDKQIAFHEIWRVLKAGGDFIACFYIRGKSKRTDWLVKNILAKKGWFSPPFQTEKELRDILQKLYKRISMLTVLWYISVVWSNAMMLDL